MKPGTGTAYFLGAGASASDGLPVTEELNYGVADFLVSPRGQGSNLAWFYRELYGIEPGEARKAADAWRTFLDDRTRRPKRGDCLPPLIETLSIMDIAIQEGRSLGVSKAVKGNPLPRELDATLIATARQELSMALGLAIGDAVNNHRTPLAHKLVATLKPADTLITTNWDPLLDRACTAQQKKSQRDRTRLRATNIAYGAVDERVVDWRGRDLRRKARHLRPLLKLHGSLNWFHCACCGTLYANVEGTWTIDPAARRLRHDYCHCDSGLENLIVTPSFIKDYRNAHVRSVWQSAQRALDEAERWVFIGYSLPADDFHIRAMLLRALRARLRRVRTKPLQVCVVATDAQVVARYKGLLRNASIQVIKGRLNDWLNA